MCGLCARPQIETAVAHALAPFLPAQSDDVAFSGGLAPAPAPAHQTVTPPHTQPRQPVLWASPSSAPFLG
jgi:hypothetical protein